MYSYIATATALAINTNNYNFSYITTIEENCDEGTRLKFDGGLDKVEDLDKVGSESELSCQ